MRKKKNRTKHNNNKPKSNQLSNFEYCTLENSHENWENKQDNFPFIILEKNRKEKNLTPLDLIIFSSTAFAC